MKITWKHNRLGIDLNPTWEVESVLVHTVEKFRRSDGTIADTVVLAIKTTPEQYRNLMTEYTSDNIKSGILGLPIIPLEPNAVLWRFSLPGYPSLTAEYMAFEIS